ncbi:MAG: metallophosphoesterase family protein [Bacilli bacterium]|nr:metallophosphoesterase family protein [Bacilli bacterium]
MDSIEKKDMLKDLTLNGSSLSSLCAKLDMSEYEILGLVRELKKENVNILARKKDDDFYLINFGEKENKNSDVVSFSTDDNNEFKFVVISDTRIGSKSQQLSILYDIYEKAKNMGYGNVIHCANITEGLYSEKHEYADSLFLSDSQLQVDYINKNYPKYDGIKTYFVTGNKDQKHLSKNNVNIGRRISNVRDDLIYLGPNTSTVMIDNVKMKIFNSNLSKTYTASYRPQQQIDSFRSEDKPDILLYGGLLQMEKFNYRNVECLTIPSVCATTDEMDKKRQSNTIGAWYVTVKTDEKGNLKSVKAMDSVYCVTDKDDYKNKKFSSNVKSASVVNSINDTDIEFVNRIYKYIKNGMPAELFMDKFHCNRSELSGILELFSIYDKDVSIELKNGIEVFNKPLSKNITKVSKLNPDDLIHTQLCVVSDTHFGNIHQQLHFLNEVYEEAYKRGIDTVLHCGDLVDGNYTNRPEQPRQQFLHGFDEQIAYVVDMYPRVKGITTKFILGSHDETHYKNDQATAGIWIPRCREDMIYLGQDFANLSINKIKITMDHPGGGSSKAMSYQPQKRIELLEPGYKPNILLLGHYHKSYAFVYRNVRGVLVGSCCDTTQFQQKQGLSNVVGAYFLDIYTDKQGRVQYFIPEEIICKKENIWDEAGKDRNKVRRLVIK